MWYNSQSMKIMIVDDEPLARIGMRTIVDWKEHGHVIVGEASGVDEALSVARRERPDVVLVDIAMPEKDGFEFISVLKGELPAVRFVIVSCMSSIDYYKKALKLEVADYIQKSTIHPNELLEVMDRLSEKIERGRVSEGLSAVSGQQGIPLAELLGRLPEPELKERIQAAASDPLIRELESPFLCIFDPGSTGPCLGNDQSMLTICQEIVRDSGKGLSFLSPDGFVVMLVAFPQSSGPAAVSCRRFTLRVIETIGQLFDLVIKVGVSGPLGSMAELRSEYQSAKDALKNAFFRPEERVFFSKPERRDSGDIIASIEAEKRAACAVSSPSDIRILSGHISAMARLLSQSRECSVEYARRSFLEVGYHAVELFRKEDFADSSPLPGPSDVVESASDILDLERRMLAFFDVLLTLYSTTFSDRGAQIVKSVKAFIDGHLTERISLKDIASAVFLSPVYVCRLFKQVTGENVMACVHKKKIDAAKPLLLQGSSVWEVSEYLSFSSESYFIKVFKRYTGKTPYQFVRGTVAGGQQS